MRVLGLASVIGIVGVAGAAGAITLRNNGGVTETSGGSVSLQQEGKPTKSPRVRAPRPLAPVPAPAETRTADASPTPVGPPANNTVVAPTAPSITSAAESSLLGQGRTTLADSIYAIRVGDSVVVNFDTKGNRTRRADKFEQMIRTTLPLVYGRRATLGLDSVPPGALLPSRDVLGALATQGVHLTLDNGVKLGLWPQTRETTDGPLVIAYRIVVER